MTPPRDFWARRKAAVEAEAQAEQAAVEAEALAREQAALEEKTDEDILSELDLPDPDTLQPGDDVSAFMAQAVPDRIRRRALRRLWRLNPVLANVDGLVDYGEDFTDAAMVVENMQTAYQVGRGMLRHVEELARQAAEAESDEADLEKVSLDLPEASDDHENLNADAVEIQSDQEVPTTNVLSTESDDPAHSEPEENQPIPRRMRFVFEG